MNFLRSLLFCVLCPIITLSQNISITGKVLRVNDKSPLRASVFLNNSSFGTATADDGTFTLNGLKPGQYTLVVTAMGYENYTQTLLVNSAQVTLNIELSPKTFRLKEVEITSVSKTAWKLYYERFKKEFIGTDDNANNCTVINPDVLNFHYNKEQNELDAWSDDFLIIENRALGYRIKYLVSDFKSDGMENTTFYSGKRFFEELPGSKSQEKKWVKKRNEAYYGSAMHFYRSLYKDSVAAEGFEMYRLTRELNTQRPKEGIIQQKLEKFQGFSRINRDNPLMRNMTLQNISELRIDSLRHWMDLYKLPLYINQSLNEKQLPTSDVLKTTSAQGIIAIEFADCLYVVYTKKQESTYFKDLYHRVNKPNYETSVVTFTNKNHVALFDRNGTILGESPLNEGTWAKAALSETLPVDYVPQVK